MDPDIGECRAGRLYLAPHKPSLQLGDVGFRVGQTGQVGPLILKPIVELGQQLPGQVVVPGGSRRRVRAGQDGHVDLGPQTPSLASVLCPLPVRV